jgi:serine/threonine protein kinase
MKETLPVRVRFGAFELDLKAGELRLAAEPEGESRIVLPDQPFRLLVMLVEREGGVVTREEIQKRFWPNNTIVEFDHSINVAIGKLRKVLGDSADEPQYMATVARRGYRLMVPVEWVEADAEEPSSGEVSSSDGGAAVGTKVDSAGLIGKKVSHYRVLEVIGGGGMGLVYKAEDLKLGRRVALKFLPEEVATDSLTLQRFEREAQTASSLNHPNICTIYEIEEHEGQPFLVMELLEGETLRDRLASSADKAVPLERLLDIAIQICDGLQAAHERGIIHRDIKPANIFITDKGVCKILDFGLAKLVATGEKDEPGAAGVILSEERSDESKDLYGRQDLKGIGVPRLAAQAQGHSLGMTQISKVLPGTPEGVPLQNGTPADATLTRTGSAMGTAGYMSPEQVRGEKLDARTDLFSFGLVLYEMATGRRAFSGDTAAILKDSIVSHRAVPVHDLNSRLPLKLEQIIDKALEKDRERRYQSAAQMGADLRSVQQRSVARSRGSRLLFVGAVAVLLCAAGFLVLRLRPRTEQPAKEPTVRQLTPGSADSPVQGWVALSPDGKHLAFGDEVNGLSILQVDTGESRSFPNTTDFLPISWLPDGEHLLVSKLGESGTWKMSTMDGNKTKVQAQTVTPCPSPDGQQLAFFDNHALSVESPGESLRKVVSVDSNWELGFLAWSPTGHRIAYDRLGGIQADTSKRSYEAQLDTCDLSGHCSTALSDPRLFTGSTPSNLAWLPDDRIIFALRELPPNDESANLWSLEVDPNTGRARGEPRRLTDWSGVEPISLSASADGKRLALLQLHTESRIKIAELRADEGGLGRTRPLNFDTWRDRPAGWTHDSRTILFNGSRHGKRGIFKQAVDDSSAETLVSGAGDYELPVLSPDGQWLFYTEYLEDGSARLMRMALEGGPVTMLLSGDYGYRCASSPSGLCVLSELKGDRVVFSRLDPLKGRGEDMLSAQVKGSSSSMSLSYAWNLSSDGKNIALVDGGSEEQIRILGIEGGVRVVHLKGWHYLRTVNWAADGRHLYVSGARDQTVGAVKFGILEADLSGNFKVLIQVPENRGWVAYAVPSPDGRYLTYTEWNFTSNVVMLENF